jgi:3'-phosphoadenosine 5'-phosphosulfate sulfotransferase (PAPS reductase)/FAD synthetase
MHLNHLKILVPISGGKDSQACMKLATEIWPEPGAVRGLFCDTQYEHPLTYQHVKDIGEMYQVRIDTVTSGSVLEQAVKHGRFPGGGARHCTEELKIWPTKRYLRALSAEIGGFEVWYGMRGGESSARAKRYVDKVSHVVYEPHEVLAKYPKYLGKAGVRFRLAIIDWSTLDVLDYLAGQENPLYTQGFDRVGCFPCLASGDAWKEKAFAHDAFGASQRAKTVRVARLIGKNIFTSKGGVERNEDGAGCAVCSI